MKKLLKGLLLVCLFAAVLFTAVGCKKENDEKTLVLGFDAEYPPFGYLDEKTLEYTGFDIEFAKLVTNEMGYKLKLVPINWDAKDAELNSGAINCIWSGFTINGRENDYEWTVPYVDNTIVVLTKANNGITKLSDLAGKNVTVQMESSAQSAIDDYEEDNTLIKSFKNGNYKLCADYTTAFQELKQGSVDAILIDITVAKYLIGDSKDYVMLEENISSEQYGVGFKLGNTELCKLVSDAMEKVSKTDDFKKIVDKYGLKDSVCIGK